jgi:TonB family protein
MQKTTLRAGLLALFAAGAAAQVFGPTVTQGGTLDDAAAEQLETSLQSNPRDVYARARLLGFYSAHAAQDQAMRGARLRQIEWLIRNEPDTLLLRNRIARLKQSDFAPPHGDLLELLRRAWQEQIDRHPDDAILIENAVQAMGSVDINGGHSEIFMQRLKRLRALEPGDPEWALDLAGLYGTALPRGMAPNAPAEAKRFGAAVWGDLENSDDAAVVGLTGVGLLGATMMQPGPQAVSAPVSDLGKSLLLRAAALNPKNPGWSRLLDRAAPRNGAELGAMFTETLQPSDLWPHGVVPPIPVPAGAVTQPAGMSGSGAYYAGPGSSISTTVGMRILLQLESLPPMAVGAPCSVRFDALIGTDDRIKTLQVAGFEHLNIPFVAATRDALRGAGLAPANPNRPVEVVTHIDLACPKQIFAPTSVNRPPAGVVGGVPGGTPGRVLGGIIGSVPSAAPPPPPQRIEQSGVRTRIRVGGNVMQGRLIHQMRPVYPPLARNARIQGVVHLSAIIDKDGKVKSATLIDGHPLLAPAALDVVKNWLYEPTLVNGEPVEVETQIDVNFTLSQ